MPVDFFEQFFKDPHLTLSLLNYPPQKIVGNRQYGIAPHTDNSFMTFLAQSNVPGWLSGCYRRVIGASSRTFLARSL